MKGYDRAVNFFDWVLIALFVVGAFWGYRKGLVDAALLVASIYFALLLSGQFAARLLSSFWDVADQQALATAAGYVIIFIGVFIAGRIVSRFIKSSLDKVKAGWTDKAGGVVVGIVAGVLLSGGLMAVTARFTYVVDEEAAGTSDNSGGFSPEVLVDQLRETAESYLVDSGRENTDEWLVDSEIAGILLDIRDILPGGALGMAPEEFQTALDILEDRRSEGESAVAMLFRGKSMQSDAV